MKVALWAEIHRLHEFERLSQRAIVRRLHCSMRTVGKALSLAEPPTANLAFIQLQRFLIRLPLQPLFSHVCCGLTSDSRL